MLYIFLVTRIRAYVKYSAKTTKHNNRMSYLPSLTMLSSSSTTNSSVSFINRINEKLKQLNHSALTILSFSRNIEFNAVTVSWEDGERTVGSSSGPRINDVYIVQTPSSDDGTRSKNTLIVRTNNFTDYVVRTSTLDIEVAPPDGPYTTVVSMSLAYVLKYFLNYTTDVLAHSGEYNDVDLTSSKLHSESHVYPISFQTLSEDSPELITHFRSRVSLSIFGEMIQSLISKFHRGLGLYDEEVTQRVMTAWLTSDRDDTPEFIVRINPYGQLSLVIIDYSIDGIRKSSWQLVNRTTTDIAIRRQEDGKWVVKRFQASKNLELSTMNSSCADGGGDSSCEMKAANDASRIRVIIVPLNSSYNPYSSYIYDNDDDESDGYPIYRSMSATEPSVYTAKMDAGSTHSQSESYDDMYRMLSTCKRANAPITVTDCFYVIQHDTERINETAITNRVSLMMEFFKSRAQKVASIHEQMRVLLTK